MKSYRISSTKNRRKSLQEMPLPSASETLKHQQDSWPSQAKRMPKKLFHVTFGTHNLHCFWSTSLARRNARKGIESPASKPLKIVARDAFAKRLRNTQTPAGLVDRPSKTHAKKNCFTLPLESIKNSNSFGAHATQYARQKTASRSASETLKHQQDSWPSQAKRMPKKLFHVTFGTHNLQCFWSTSLARRNARKGIESPASKPLKIVARDAFAKRLRNTQTPAGFVAKPSKTHAKKTVSRYLWNP